MIVLQSDTFRELQSIGFFPAAVQHHSVVFLIMVPWVASFVFRPQSCNVVFLIEASDRDGHTVLYQKIECCRNRAPNLQTKSLTLFI